MLGISPELPHRQELLRKALQTQRYLCKSEKISISDSDDMSLLEQMVYIDIILKEKENVGGVAPKPSVQDQNK